MAVDVCTVHNQHHLWGFMYVMMFSACIYRYMYVYIYYALCGKHSNDFMVTVHKTFVRIQS